MPPAARHCASPLRGTSKIAGGSAERRGGATGWAILLGALFFFACGGGGSAQPGNPAQHPAATGPGIGGQTAALTPEQKHRTDELISLFENGTVVIQYGYAEDIHDGRGLTAGRAGFTTATGDLLMVVESYSRQHPENALARYLPVLTERARAGTGDLQGLDGLASAWAAAALDPAFRTVQDEISDHLYYEPAGAHARDLGARMPITLAVLYDTAIQHGDGEDPDGAPALIQRATAAAGGTPGTGVNEARWLAAFLRERRQTLLHARDPATRSAWAASVGRVDAWSQLLQEGNWDLRGPIRLNTKDYQEVVP
ncbi:MAG: chitosanase [Actinomycetota bacterium]